MIRIFVLEDNKDRIYWFKRIFKDFDLTIAMSTKGAKLRYNGVYDILFLDHDLGGEVYVDSKEENTGAGFARWLMKDEDPYGVSFNQVVIHSMNPTGAKNIMGILEKGACISFGDLQKYIKDVGIGKALESFGVKVERPGIGGM